MKIEWKENFKNMKLAKKMLLVYAFFAGISCIISMASLQMSLNIYDGKLYEKSLQELDFFSQQVNESLEDIEKLSSYVALDRDIQEQLSELRSCKYMSATYAVELFRLRELIADEMASYPVVKSILYTDGKQAMTKAGLDTGMLSEEDVKEMLEQFHEVKGGYITRNPDGRNTYLISGRDILERKNASLDYMGSLILTSDIADVIEQKNDSLEAVHSALFVYSEDGMVYQEEGVEVPELPSLEKEKGYKILRDGGEKYFMCYLKSGVNGWMYVNFFPYSDIFGQTMQVRYLLLAGMVLLFIIIVGVMRKMAVVITRPLNQLTESMQIVEQGDFKGAKEVLDKEPGNDETGLLAQEFKAMLDKIDVLIYENYEKQLLLKDTKYKMLQAQINPHFLYNTLNALNWMVKGGQNADAGKMIMELGKVLRSSFAGDPYTTVADELETAKGYMVIQKYRYQSRVHFHVHEEGNLRNYLIPRMILQPLIENAIYYGVETSLDVCDITVRAKEMPDSVILSVEDNGQGMTQEELERVKDGSVIPKGHGIGIKNIRERLKITYEDSEFTISSQTGCGTKIYIRIPKTEGEEHV